MAKSQLQAEQAVLKAQYEGDPGTAKVTLTAEGSEELDARACSVEVGGAIHEVQLHEGVGGPGTAACSGDLLLGSLAACSQLTAQAVADSFGVEEDVNIEVSVEGDLDLRGTLGLGDVPVGFQDIRMTVTVEGNIEAETVDALQTYTEEYCVVYQTLENLSGVETEWRTNSV